MKTAIRTTTVGRALGVAGAALFGAVLAAQVIVSPPASGGGGGSGAAEDLTGTTIAANVVASSLTSFGSQPTLTDFTNATHTHLNAAGGGTLTVSALSNFNAASVIALWSGTCNSSSVLGGDGVCAAVSSAFSGLTSATNTTAAMVVGTGASLAASGSGTITATSLVTPATLTSAVGSSALTIAGGTQTASFPALAVTQTWNNGAVSFTGLDVNVTNTASASTSYPLDVRLGGTYLLRVRRDGYVHFSNFEALGSTLNFYMTGGNLSYIAQAAGITLNGTAQILGEASNVLALRNTTNAQKFRLYNTSTTLNTAGEWFKQDWQTTANQFRMGTVRGTSTGTARVLTIDYGGLEASGDITFGGPLVPTGYKSSDGSAGVTVTGCTSFKDGLCVAGT